MEVSHPERVVYPEVGITKAQVVGYYEDIAGRMFPFVEGRPLTLERYPKGLATKGFMQKNAARHFPSSIRRFEVPKADGGVTRYPVVTEPWHLPYLANQGTIAFHVWGSRVEHVERPDLLVVDLDPDDGDFERVRRVALAARSVLDGYGVPSVPMTTGSKGYHLRVRLDGSHGWERIGLAARALGGLVVEAAGDDATLEFLKKDRRGRVFVDWLRNHPGATAVAPYSLRAKPRATVAVPFHWDDLAVTDPDRYTLADVSAFPEVGWPEPVRLPVDEIVGEAKAAGVDLETPFDRFGRK